MDYNKKDIEIMPDIRDTNIIPVRISAIIFTDDNMPEIIIIHQKCPNPRYTIQAPKSDAR